MVPSRLPMSLALVFALAAAAPACTEEDSTLEKHSSVQSALGGLPFGLTIDHEYRRLVIESQFTGSDGNPIRFKLYELVGRQDGYLIFVNGRAEFIEKYDALFTSLHEFPLDVAPADQTMADLRLSFATLDNAGQGESIEGRTPGHIESFDAFVDDLRKLVTLVRFLQGGRRPIYLASHSMGGLISARFVQQYPELVDGLLLSSPMLVMRDVPGLPEPALRFVAHFYAVMSGMPRLCTVPPGLDQETVAGVALCAGGLLEDSMPGCQHCFNTADGCGVAEVQGLQAAFAYMQSIADQGCPASTFACPAPYLSTDDDYCDYAQIHALAGPEPTFGWLNAAFAGMDAFYAAPPVATRTLILANPDDVIVGPSGFSCEHFAGDCDVIEFPGMGHELLTAADRMAPIATIREFFGY